MPPDGCKHGRRYPWDRWFSRPGFTLVRGRDYEVTTYGMLQMVRRHATDRGLRVRIKDCHGHIEVTVVGERP